MEKFCSNIGKLLQDKDNRTSVVIRNSIASAVFKTASLACSLIIVPITIGYLNAENYGIWMTITSILYWFSFFDIGLGNGMRNYLAEAFAANDFCKARIYLSTSIFVLALLVTIIGCVALPIIYTCDFNYIFNVYSIDRLFLARVICIATVFSLIQIVAKNIGMVYIALQKYAINDLILFLGNIFSLLTILILIKTTEANLTYIVLAFTGIPVIMFIFAAFPLFKQYPELKLSLKVIDFDATKKIISKGLGFFIIQITSCLVIFGSANILISHYCGPEQVTVYNISYKYFNILTIAYTILISPLWNAYTHASVNNDYAWIKKTFKRSLLLWTFLVLAGVIALALSSRVYKLWIGDSIHVPFIVSTCIFTYICLFNLNNCATYLINGVNKIRVQIITSIITSIAYVVCILMFIKGKYGIVGISVSMTAAYSLMSIIHLYQCFLLANGKAKGIWNK